MGALHYSNFIYSLKENHTLVLLIGVEGHCIIWIYGYFSSADNELIRVS